MNTIDDMWRSFEESVIPATAPPVQRQEMKKAFYAGASSILHMGLGVIGDESVSENAGVAIIQGWQDECQMFAERVINGLE